MLTQRDFDQVEKLTRNIVKEEIKNLPAKDEFYTKMDEVMGELKAIREKYAIFEGKFSRHSDQLENHEERITKLEQTPTAT